MVEAAHHVTSMSQAPQQQTGVAVINRSPSFLLAQRMLLPATAIASQLKQNLESNKCRHNEMHDTLPFQGYCCSGWRGPALLWRQLVRQFSCTMTMQASLLMLGDQDASLAGWLTRRHVPLQGGSLAWTHQRYYGPFIFIVPQQSL